MRAQHGQQCRGAFAVSEMEGIVMDRMECAWPGNWLRMCGGGGPCTAETFPAVWILVLYASHYMVRARVPDAYVRVVVFFVSCVRVCRGCLISCVRCTFLVSYVHMVCCVEWRSGRSGQHDVLRP